MKGLAKIIGLILGILGFVFLFKNTITNKFIQVE